MRRGKEKTMVNVAILGFGVVGSGVAEVLTQNKKIIEDKTQTEINIKYILDLRDFPEVPLKVLLFMTSIRFLMTPRSRS